MPANKVPAIYLYRRVVQAKLFIDSNYHSHINLDNIAGEAYFSKFHFIRIFRNVYGKTPHQYLISVRIEKAKLLLQSGSPVAKVCFGVGFDSISSFTGLFKKVARVVPSVYQRQAMEVKASMESAPLRFVPGCFAESNGWA
jgi:AraC-like DNA-binding protein